MEITLLACRANARMTREQFAQEIGVTSGTIANWENGKTEPSLTHLRKISEVSKIPIDNIAIGANCLAKNS
jgi:DNA-binding XRE family transcriptional regulator